jgi:hypothetical protein
LTFSHKKAYINNGILNKTPKRKFRANALVKNPFEDGPLLQQQLTLFKDVTLSLPKKILM